MPGFAAATAERNSAASATWTSAAATPVASFTHEGALHISDVLTRRTRLFFEAPEGGAAAAGAVAAIMGDLLGWDGATRASEIESYLEFAAAETQAIRDPGGRRTAGQAAASQAAASQAVPSQAAPRQAAAS